MEDSVYSGIEAEVTPTAEEASDSKSEITPTEEAVSEDAVPEADIPEVAVDTEDYGAAEEPTTPSVDYDALMREDLETLRATFPELKDLPDVSALSGAMRYAALRDMGLSAVEAYMASSAPRTRRDNRSHLSSPVTRGAGAPKGAMSHSELCAARELFSEMTDAEIHSLYKRVNG